MYNADIFARHLDLTPLKGHRRGKVRCIFHQERTASLSVDLDGAVFHCFGCGAQGGVVKFAQLVGESGEAPMREPAPGTVWAAGCRLATQQRWSRESLRDLSEVGDWIKRTRRDIAHVRAIATEADWDALARCARLETVANWAEAEQDDVLGRGPIA